MDDIGTFTVNYKVAVTKVARKQGLKLGISDKERLWIIQEMKLLKFWPAISDRFDFEGA
ncbi:MAG: hypothetical protein HY074_04250 [Deltaproteobacteria bacterium]|nr:hypothetical protein [Deltaproteobacteria bacterium]